MALAFVVHEHAALAHFRASPDITNFALDLRDIGDDDLVLFREWKNLTTLGLGASSVTDAGLNHLKEYKNLTRLRLRQSKITTTGVDGLKQALPNCRIEWDGGVIEPSNSAQPK